MNDEIDKKLKEWEEELKKMSDEELLHQLKDCTEELGPQSLKLLDFDLKLYSHLTTHLQMVLEMTVRFERYAVMVAASELIREKLENTMIAIRTAQTPGPKN